MIAKIRTMLDEWAQRGPTWLVMLKTALTHALVWTGATVAGAMVGVLVIGLFGVRPVWASALPMFSYALGARFYLDREFAGDKPDFVYADSFRERVDSVIDFVVPWVIASAALYGTMWLYIRL